MILRPDSYYEHEQPEALEFPRRRVRAARKDFTCGACGRPITKGTAYYRCVGIYEGEFYTYRHHISFCEERGED